MRSTNPYLNFNGRTEEAFNFYRSVFGGEFTMFQRFKDMPEMPGAPKIDGKDREKLLKDCCSYAGIDPSRVDDHQQDVVWELLSWVEPVLKIRRYLVELMGPVVNCTPERIRMQK